MSCFYVFSSFFLVLFQFKTFKIIYEKNQQKLHKTRCFLRHLVIIIIISFLIIYPIYVKTNIVKKYEIKKIYINYYSQSFK
jgi:uncharacterized BrkB/YihY/UPF0761 family membrane protein